MAECEICGKPLLTQRKARIDGVVFTVCESCLKLGEEMPVIMPVVRKNALPKPIIGEDCVLIENFGEKIRGERQKRGLTQEELASKISERASLIKKAEQSIELEENVIKKLEKFLCVKLYEKPDAFIPKGREEHAVLTLGDVAEIRRKRA